MRKILCLALLTGMCYTASSQVIIALLFGKKLNTDKLEFGLVVSPVYSTISNVGGKYKSGVNLSLYFNVKLNENLFFHPEASPKASFGSKEIEPYSIGDAAIDSVFADGGTVKRKLKAMSVPLLMRYRIKGLLFAEAGPQIDWIIKSRDVFEKKMDDNSFSYTNKIGSKVANFQVGVAAGLEYKFRHDKGMGLGIRYYYGLTDVMKDISASHSSVWMINIGIPIGTGKQQDVKKTQ